LSQASSSKLEPEEAAMLRLISCVLAAGAVLAAGSALGAPTPERVRGTVGSISGDTLTIQARDGSTVPITVTGDTRYLQVVKSDLARVAPNSYIGTATKNVGDRSVALEVVVFPASMRGAGEGHYDWDRIPDTTLSGSATASSSMTNGTVSAAVPAGGGGTVNTTKTNGAVGSASEKGGAKQITVTYQGGQQIILVPPTATIVTFRPGTAANLKSGAPVFIRAMREGNHVTAQSVAVGMNGLTPPM